MFGSGFVMVGRGPVAAIATRGEAQIMAGAHSSMHRLFQERLRAAKAGAIASSTISA